MNTSANILESYRDDFTGPAAIVVTDSVGNVLRRANRKSYPSREAALKSARTICERSSERCVCWRAVPVSALSKIGL